MIVLSFIALAFSVDDMKWSFDRPATVHDVPADSHVDSNVTMQNQSAVPGLPPPKPLSERLTAFYQKFAPSKMDHVHETLKFYGCAENEYDPKCKPTDLNSMLMQEYGMDLTAPGFGGRTIKLGETVKLNDLGPIVVNRDGTLRRITNWHKMTDREQKVTIRRIGSRNRKRLAALKKQKAQKAELR